MVGVLDSIHNFEAYENRHYYWYGVQNLALFRLNKLMGYSHFLAGTRQSTCHPHPLLYGGVRSEHTHASTRRMCLLSRELGAL